MDELYNLKIFTWIDKEIVKNIINILKKEAYTSGQIIINQWELSNWKWFIIIDWEVDIFINSEKITSLWKWEIFWEIALLNEEDRTATIIAKTDLEVLVITQDAILEIMNEDNSLNKEIMRRVSENIENNR